MSDPIATKEILRQLGELPVRIGLRQQGHMDTVIAMLLDGATWEEIGAAIHWHPDAAKQWWCVEAAKEVSDLRCELNAIRYVAKVPDGQSVVEALVGLCGVPWEGDSA